MRTGLFIALLAAATAFSGCGGSTKSTQNAGDPGVGTTTTTDQPVATDPIATACRNGIAKSCLSAAASAAQANRIDDARELYAKGCELGEPLGCLYAGEMAADGESPDLKAAVAYLSRGCELKEPAACYGGALVHSGLFGGEADMAAAAALHRKGCNLNLADSCTALGEFLLAGTGVEKDEAKGLELLTMACNAEEGGACIVLGAREEDPAAARKMYERACGYGDGQGCTLVALASEESVRQEWFEKGCAAEVPDPTSCTYAALPGFSGDQPERAAAVFQQTCEFEEPMGCFFAAIAFRDGTGVEADPERAEDYLNRACGFGPDQCERFRSEFEAPKK